MAARFDLNRILSRSLTMNADLAHFLRPLLQVIAATLFAVFTVAFVSLPYNLASHPGDPHAATQGAPRHMT